VEIESTVLGSTMIPELAQTVDLYNRRGFMPETSDLRIRIIMAL